MYVSYSWPAVGPNWLKFFGVPWGWHKLKMLFFSQKWERKALCGQRRALQLEFNMFDKRELGSDKHFCLKFDIKFAYTEYTLQHCKLINKFALRWLKCFNSYSGGGGLRTPHTFLIFSCYFKVMTQWNLESFLPRKFPNFTPNST